MKHRVLWLLLVLFACAVASSAQNPQQLFTQALTQERAAGNLEQAIEIYQRVAKDTTDRALAAQALINAARAYDKLGQTQASKSLYTQVARAYPEQRQQADAARQNLSGMGTIEGTVMRSGSGEPVKDATIILDGGPPDPDALRLLTAYFAQQRVTITAPAGAQSDEILQNLTDAAAARGISMIQPQNEAALAQFKMMNAARFSATTNDTGRFVLKDVPAGKYRVAADRDGFFPPPTGLREVTVTVTPGRTSLAELSLMAGAAISGRITDEAGQPQPNIQVQAFSVRYQSGFPVLQAAVSKTTDDRGEYRLFWLQDGEYLVAASPRVPVQPIPVTAATASVLQMPNAQRTYFPGTSDISVAVPVIVQRGALVTGIDIGLRRTPTFKISGEVRSHIPVPQGRINNNAVVSNLALTTRDMNVPEDIQFAGQQTGTIPLRQSGADFVGSFTINGVLPGAYDLKAFTNEFNGPAIRNFSFTSTSVDVFNQDVSGIVIDIYPAVAVSGVVTIDGRTPGPDTVRIGLQVEGSNAKRPSYQGLASRPVVAGSQDGAFTIPIVQTGRFHVQPGAGLPPNLYIENVFYAGQSVFDSGFDVGSTEIKGVQVSMRSGAGIVEGTVKDSAGKPVAGATAVLVPPVARRQNRYLYRTATTDSLGHFKIDGIAPGNYDLFAWPSVPDGAYYNTRFLSRYQDRARPVRVGQSTTTSNQDLVALPAVGR